MMKGVVMINRNVLFSSADYNMIINVTRAGSLTISSAGVTVCSLVLICQAGWVSAGGCLFTCSVQVTIYMLVGVRDNDKCVSVTQWYVCVCLGE